MSEPALLTNAPELTVSELSGALKRAIEDKKIRVKFYNPRDFSDDKWARVDQKPYGGGPGMVMQALPVIKAKATDIFLRFVPLFSWAPPKKNISCRAVQAATATPPPNPLHKFFRPASVESAAGSPAAPETPAAATPGASTAPGSPRPAQQHDPRATAMVIGGFLLQPGEAGESFMPALINAGKQSCSDPKIVVSLYGCRVASGRPCWPPPLLV